MPILLLFATCLFGCGGNGGSQGLGVVNVFQGTWTGPWSSGNDQGTATFHITGLGSVAGTIMDATTNQTYQVTGQLLTPTLSSTTINLSETNSGNTVLFSGTIVEKGSFSSFSGNLTQVSGSGTTQTISLGYTGT